MIPDLTVLAESLGLRVALVPLALAGAFTALVLCAQSIAKLFDDRNH